MSSVIDLNRALKEVALGDTIKEARVFIKDGSVYIVAMDMTQSIFVETTAKLEVEDTEMGIGDLQLLIKYLSTLKDIDVNLKMEETAVVFKPKSGATVKYLLTEPEVIASYDDAWDGMEDVIDTQIEEGTFSKLELKQDKVSEFTAVMNMFSPNSISIKTNKRGAVIIHGGREADHQFDITLGSIEPIDLDLKVYGKHFSEILSTIDYSETVTMYLATGSDIIIKTPTTGWVIRPLELDGE